MCWSTASQVTLSRTDSFGQVTFIGELSHAALAQGIGRRAQGKGDKGSPVARFRYQQKDSVCWSSRNALADELQQKGYLEPAELQCIRGAGVLTQVNCCKSDTLGMLTGMHQRSRSAGTAEVAGNKRKKRTEGLPWA